LMKNRVILLVLSVLLFSGVLVFTVPATSAAPAQGGKTIVFLRGPACEYSGDRQLVNVTKWLTGLGYTCRNATAINSSILAGADALIMAPPMYAAGRAMYNQTNAPAMLAAIRDWYNLGGKFLWVGGDSDYYQANGNSGDWIIEDVDMVMAAVGCSPV